MAFEITYTATIPIAGSSKALTRVEGSCYANSVTGGDISGLTKLVRHFYAWGFTPRQNIAAGAYNVVKSFVAADDADKLTLTCSLSDYFDFWYIGDASGDQ
jgi:hypothetical protein